MRWYAVAKGTTGSVANIEFEVSWCSSVAFSTETCLRNVSSTNRIWHHGLDLSGSRLCPVAQSCSV